MPQKNREIIANVERLHAHMARADLAAVVARSGQNFTYLSGVVMPGTLARHLDFPDSDRAVMLIWPRGGPPVIVANSVAAGLIRRDSWVERVEIYAGYTDSPYGCLCRVLRELGLDGERVGFEQTTLSARDWGAVQDEMPGLTMVDCTAMMDRVRWIKTAQEVARIKAAADLLDDAYAAVFPTIRPGETERDVHSRLIGECLRRGAGWAHGILYASSNLVSYCGEGDTVFRPGDVMATDYVAYRAGYPGHQSRTVIVGKASAAQRKTYTAYRDVYRRTIEQCRPGVTAGAVHAFAMAQFARHGWVTQSLLVGHGVGAWWHQQAPILAAGSEVVLEEGMVLAVEPHFDQWYLQDLVRVTAADPELLSAKFNTDAPWETG